MTEQLEEEEHQTVSVDGESASVDPDTTIAELAEQRNRSDVVGAKVDGTVMDLRDTLETADEVEFLTFDDPEGKSIYWHTTAHVLAQAVQMYFDDDVKLGVGPPIEDGFYYDFDLPRTLSEDELRAIENIMKNIVDEDLELVRYYEETDEAIAHLEEMNEEYKIELVEELDDKPSFYRQDGFEDLCSGPHLRSTGDIGALKLTKLSGSYWKGDQENADMQRIYGISFPTSEQLEEYEQKIEEAKKRDHRKLGQELDLFHIEEDVGPGLVIWHPKGSRIRSEIENYWEEEHREHGYELVNTPHLAQEKLWEISGHLDHYSENMFPSLDMEEKEEGGRTYRVKPMNCPFHMKIFNSDTRSYRDLPMRLAELGTVYRYERSGVLHGLMRVRGFTQDDAHVFCTPDQLEDELINIISFIEDVLNTFGFEDFEIFVSTRPEKYVGSDERWELATNALKEALDAVGLEYDIDPGEGVFYGPKIDLKIRDSLDREWQCSTIQVDFNLPEQFDIEYDTEDGERKRPIMIHRAVFGSLERFFGVLTEHYGGAFPVWLAPTPVWILPISDENVDYCETISEKLDERNIRNEIKDPNESLGKRIRNSQTQKIPYTFIIGSDEEESNEVEVRQYGKEDSESRTLDNIVDQIAKEKKSKALLQTN